MGSLRIEKSQPVTTNSKLNFRGNKSGFNWENYEVEETTYKFYGKESFDYHDLNNFTLKDMFSGSYGNKKYDKMLADGYMGYAFDNASQIVVDSFLRVYFDNFEVMEQYLGLKQSNKENEIANQRIFIKNYITDKCLMLVVIT